MSKIGLKSINNKKDNSNENRNVNDNYDNKIRKVYMGIDTGSVSINTVILSEEGEFVAGDYRRTKGRLVHAVRESFEWFQGYKKTFPEKIELAGVGITGSGRRFTAALCGADLVKNEITAHTAAAIESCPDVKTLLEIGGEDSKIVIIRDGVPVDFAMNTLCAAGTGAFMDQLAGRLGLAVEDLGDMALSAENETSISGRCTVFAESDIIFKQQAGAPLPDIVKGLCRSLVRNYLSDTGQGKPLEPPFLFQGGVAANKGIRQAFAEELGEEIIVPEHYNVMGAKGVALLVREEMIKSGKKSVVKPLEYILTAKFATDSFNCEHCGNHCEIIRFKENDQVTGTWGGRCERWG